MNSTTTTPQPSSADTHLTELAAALETDLDILKEATRLNPETGELASPEAFCKALHVPLAAYDHVVWYWGGTAAHNRPEPTDSAAAVALTTLRAVGDRRFLHWLAMGADPTTTSEARTPTVFAGGVAADAGVLRQVLDALFLNSTLGVGSSEGTLAAAAGCRVASLALATIEREAEEALESFEEIKPC